MKKRIIALITLLLVSLLMFGCGTDAAQAQPEVGEKSEAQGVYKLGDKVEDFSVTLCDGTELTLYGLLSEKRAVLINVWATYCGPCRAEFPYMQSAYDKASDKLGLIAVSGWDMDTDESVAAFKEELGLDTLSMGVSTELAERFGANAFPTSIMIDRNATVCFIESGSITDEGKFLRLFDVYTADDYTEPVLLDKIPLAVPDVEMPSVEALTKALDIADDKLALSLSEDSFAWPFLPDGDAVTASNGGEPETEAKLVVRVKADAGEALAYEYKTELYPAYDNLYVTVNDEFSTIHADSADWTEAYIPFEKAGEYTLCFTANHFVDYPTSMSLRKLHIISAEDTAVLETSREPIPEKSLSGASCEISVVSGDLKAAAIEILEDGAVTDSLDLSILQGDALTLRFKIGEGVNDALAYYTVGEACGLVSSLPRDKDGYLYEYRSDKQPSDSAVMVFADIYASALAPLDAALCELVWLGSESDADEYAALVQPQLEQQGIKNAIVQWRYLDGPVESASLEGSDYSFVVTDEQGGAVKGVMLQICDEDTCQIVQTDETGTATLSLKPASYEIHVLAVPDGYEKSTEVYILPTDGRSLNIELKKS